MAYKTPGVYVEEIPVFPPSVAAVATAVPAFIGYTEYAKDENSTDVSSFPYVKRISSLLEYRQFFGGTLPQAMTIVIENDVPTKLSGFTASVYQMYYAMQLFYANGGGPCYIISVGLQSTGGTIDHNALMDSGLTALKKLDEPTLILFPDATSIGSASGYYDVYKAALDQCAVLGDRFVIMDIYGGKDANDASDTPIHDFRTNIGSNNLKYGAAYHPFLKTSLNYFWNNASVTFDASSPSNSNATLNGQKLADISAIIHANEQRLIATQAATDAAAATTDIEAIAIGKKGAQAAVEAAKMILEAATATKNPNPPNGAQTALNDANSALGAANAAADKTAAATAATDAADAANDALAAAVAGEANLANILAIFTSAFEQQLLKLIGEQYVVLPPSSSMAGIYAMVDNTRGVWKAPANVSLNNVIAPSVKISNQDQDGLNVDPGTGKSINAIRAFAGKGIIVWGARTLAGNDNEWRYVSVRRFFNMAEESIKKATEPFVFEPNDANTWIRVRSMIENFLTVQWRAGALAGATPEDAFFVKVGIGQTMTSLDILEGRMNIEIGMAVVRPAEFIILKFSHKMQVS